MSMSLIKYHVPPQNMYHEKNINEQITSSKDYYSGLKGVVDNINETIEHTNKLNTGVKELESNIASLNSVYGNMLSSLNFNK